MILPLSNGVQQLTGLGWAWQWTVFNEPVAVTTQYLPRLDVYGSRAVRRLDVLGSAAIVRLDTYGSDAAKRLDVFGGDGTE